MCKSTKLDDRSQDASASGYNDLTLGVMLDPQRYDI